MSGRRGLPEYAIERARELRRHGTPAEGVLWSFLRGRQLHGLKFRRQHPIGPFIVDFFCPARGLIIELDGWVHEDRVEQDAARTRYLETHGHTVIRFDNQDVANKIDDVLERIMAAAGVDG